MTATLIDGKIVAAETRKRLQHSISIRTENNHRPPGLAVILLGEDPASKIYVKNKRKACEEVGIRSFAYDLSEQTSEAELLQLIDSMNQNKEIDGILVQLPLPAHIKKSKVIERIKPQKDVDGFHPYNAGCLAQGHPLLRPCTPYGIMQLFHYYQLPIKGQHAVIVGASTIVGRPMALEFLHAKATVTVCHRLTQHLDAHIRMADIVVVATGVADVVPTQWLHSKQIVIDVGIHRLSDGRIRGDVDFASAKEKVAWLTPVPGGVGPMTICALLQNTLQAAEMSIESVTG
jgi:methylenetetrahydrofolate dehydrogenase (NADP+)/methenyltetrahydrofolate cyclohydrolase